MAFGWDDAFLLSMMAAGAIVPLVQGHQSQGLIKLGRQLEQSSIDTNLEALRTQSAESSLASIQSLRENVATQIVTSAARGVASGGGSAQGAIQKAEGNFGRDEKTRRLNLLMKENELRAANVLSGIHTLTSETQLGQSLTNQIFNNLPISALAQRFKTPTGNKTLKSEIPSLSSQFGKKSGFGLTPV